MTSRKVMKLGENGVEAETSLRVLIDGERSPVEESFCESYIIQSRTAVDNLYASNVLSCQEHVKVMKDLSRQRKVTLASLTREQNKLVKKMENLKEKQESYSSSNIFQLANHTRRSFPPLTHARRLKVAKQSDRLNVPSKSLSKSCDDLTSLHKRPVQALILPLIKPARSYESLAESPFITHVQKPPLSTRNLVIQEHFQSKKTSDLKGIWHETKAPISTKVKWVPRN